MSKQQQYRKPERPPKHDATFWHDGTYTRRPYWRPGTEPPRALAGWKLTLIVAVGVALLYGLMMHRTGTEWVLVLVFGPVIGALAVAWFRRLQEWHHYRARVRPLASALVAVIDQPMANPRSWLTVPQDYATDPETEVVIGVPDDFTGAERDMEDVTRAVAAKLSFPNPQVTQHLGGRAPRLVCRHACPPPEGVSLPDIRPYIEAAKPSQVILGLAAKDEATDLDMDSETPMVGVSMTTGCGKSELTKNMAAQLAYHGALVMILDYKLVSHMWADGLPNVCYARTPQEIHEALMWLAWDECDADGNVTRPSELTRRKEVVLAAARRHETPDVGPRLFIIAEERNATVRVIRRQWRRMGGKGSPPALEALDETGETGRQVCVNIAYVAQRLSAKASGSDGSADARENIGAIITKDATEATWKMLANGHAQPPKSGHPGRYQLIQRQGVTDYQGVLYDRDPQLSDAMARELAMSGTVAAPRFDMPFVNRGPLLVPAAIGQDALARQEGSEQAFVLGPQAGVLPPGEGPERAVTIAQAVAAGIFVSKEAGRKAVRRRKWEVAGGTKAAGFKYRIEDLYEYKLSQEKR